MLTAMESVPGGTPRSRKSGRPTIRDVAQLAGVGLGTASRVLNKDTHVRPETRRRVLAAARRLRFQASLAARGLAKGRTGAIGVLVPFFTKHYFLEILRGIEQTISSSDASLIIYNVERRQQVLAHLRFLARTRRVDGLLVISLSGNLIGSVYQRSLPFPIVYIDSDVENSAAVSVDHEAAMDLAVRHLTGLGHTRLALIDRPQDPVSDTICPARREGYRKACREAGLGVPESHVVLAEYSRDGGYEAAMHLLKSRRPPTAIACASDLQAIGAMEAVADAGLRVGHDVSVTGYHDVELARYVGLTTVHLPAIEMGAAAAGLLLRGLRLSTAKELPKTFPPQLIIRGSSGKLRHTRKRRR